MPIKRKSWLERFLSLNQHRKKLGARRVVLDSDLAELRTRIIEGSENGMITRGSEKALDLHLKNLRREFAGQSELLWHHAKLIVLLRRHYRVKNTYARFIECWRKEGEFLRAQLNLRWLISAADTFVDFDSDPQVRAAGIMVSLIGNAVKLGESERWICDTMSVKPRSERIELTKHTLVPLFSGVSCFSVGTDDTLRNLYLRIEPNFRIPLTGSILETVWNKLQVEDNVFARMRCLHTRQRTRWWN